MNWIIISLACVGAATLGCAAGIAVFYAIDTYKERRRRNPLYKSRWTKL